MNASTESFHFPPDIRENCSRIGVKSSKSPPIRISRSTDPAYTHSTRRIAGSHPQHQMLYGSVYSTRRSLPRPAVGTCVSTSASIMPPRLQGRNDEAALIPPEAEAENPLSGGSGKPPF